MGVTRRQPPIRCACAWTRVHWHVCITLSSSTADAQVYNWLQASVSSVYTSSLSVRIKIWRVQWLSIRIRFQDFCETTRSPIYIRPVRTCSGNLSCSDNTSMHICVSGEMQQYAGPPLSCFSFPNTSVCERSALQASLDSIDSLAVGFESLAEKRFHQLPSEHQSFDGASWTWTNVFPVIFDLITSWMFASSSVWRTRYPWFPVSQATGWFPRGHEGQLYSFSSCSRVNDLCGYLFLRFWQSHVLLYVWLSRVMLCVCRTTEWTSSSVSSGTIPGWRIPNTPMTLWTWIPLC